MFNKDFRGLHEAAFVLALSAFASQVLALFRDRLFAAAFGADRTLDIYYAAFRVPDFLYVLVASLVAATVLIPFVVERMKEDDRSQVNRFLNSVLDFFLLFLILATAVAYFAMPKLAGMLVPGFSEAETATFITLSRILLLQPFFLGISNLIGSVTQALRRFLVYALAPILYNVGIIIGIMYFFDVFGINGLAYGVVLGALLHFAIQVPVVFGAGVFPRVVRVPAWKDIRGVVAVSLPRTITGGAHQLIIIIFTALASAMAAGSITIFTLSYNLQSVPLAIIGVSYSVAAFPTLSRLFTDGAGTYFVTYVLTAARHIIFWSLPVLALIVVLRAQIVRTILGAGAFDWIDTRLTAAALALFSVSVAAQGLVLLFVRAYYAAGRTAKPLFLNVFAAATTVWLGYLFLVVFDNSQPFRLFFESLFRVEALPGTRVLMLPFAFSIGAIINVTLVWTAFKRDFPEGYVSARRAFFETFAGALVAGFVAHRLLRVFAALVDIETFWGIFLQGFLAGVGGVLAGVALFELLGNKEYREMRRALTARILRRKPVQPDLSPPEAY